jgi:hypothetical protein
MKPEIGTISHGTFRPQDLLRSFSEAYEQYCKDQPGFRSKLATRAKMLADLLDRNDPHPTDRDVADEFIDEIIDELNKIASLYGCYFGSHPGDGSDFGFWPNDEAEY